MRWLRLVTQSTALEFIAQTLQLLVLPIGIGVVVAIWQILREGWSPMAAVIGIWAGVGLLVAMQQFLAFRSRMRNSPSSWGDERLSRSLRDWAYAASFGIYPNAEKEKQASVRFAFDVRDRAARGVTIARLANQIEFTARVVFPPAHAAEFKKLTAPELAKLRGIIGYEFARYGIGFDSSFLDQSLPDDQVSLNFRDQSPADDSLTQYVFVGKLFFIRRAILLAQLVVGSFLGGTAQVPEESQESPPASQSGQGNNEP